MTNDAEHPGIEVLISMTLNQMIQQDQQIFWRQFQESIDYWTAKKLQSELLIYRFFPRMFCKIPDNFHSIFRQCRLTTLKIRKNKDEIKNHVTLFSQWRLSIIEISRCTLSLEQIRF